MKQYDIEKVRELYDKYKNLHKVAKELHTSHIPLSRFMKDNGIKLLNVGKKKNVTDSTINDMIEYYLDDKEYHTMEDVSKKFGVRIKRVRQIFESNGISINRWRFHKKKDSKKIEHVKIEYEYKYCPYCEWKTRDVDGKANQYQMHLEHVHNVDIKEHLRKYPEDRYLLRGAVDRLEKVKCAICGEYKWLIDNRHLKKHGLTVEEYKEIYGDVKLVSKRTHDKLSSSAKEQNANVVYTKESFTSHYENELASYIESLNFTVERCNRSILGGQEIDIYVPSANLGIEIDGLLWHSEFFGGKTKEYHLSKTLRCAEKGIKLIHIFEDEIRFSKNIVYGRIRNLLGVVENKLYARKCKVVRVFCNNAQRFLKENHLQGYIAFNIGYGLEYNGKLVSVMTFRYGHLRNKTWEISRYTTKIGYNVIGGASKLLKKFIKDNNPTEIMTYADIRWSPFKWSCVYGKIGMTLEEVQKPSYFYINQKILRDKRINRISMTKKVLSEKYQLPNEMTELDMARLIGCDRIWDCGLFKYVWRRSDND